MEKVRDREKGPPSSKEGRRAALGMGGDILQHLQMGACAVPAQCVACFHGQEIGNIVPLSPRLLLTKGISIHVSSNIHKPGKTNTLLISKTQLLVGLNS